MDTSTLVDRSRELAERASKLAKDSERSLRQTLDEIVEGTRIAAADMPWKNLSPTDLAVAASLSEHTLKAAEAFASLGDEERSRITLEAEEGNMEPYDLFAAQHGGEEPLFVPATGDAPVPAETDESAWQKSFGAGMKFGGALFRAVSLAQFAETMLDPRRSLVSKSLRASAFGVNLWNRKTALTVSPFAEVADAIVLAEAFLGPRAIRASGPEKTRAYWRATASAIVMSNLDAGTPIRDFALRLISGCQLVVADDRITDAAAINRAISRSQSMPEDYLSRVMPTLFKDVSFATEAGYSSTSASLRETLRIGLQKKVLQPSDDGSELVVKGVGVHRSVGVPNGSIPTSEGSFVPLRRLFAEAARSEAFASGHTVYVNVPLHITSVGTTPSDKSNS